jgi:hypothetical protein
MTMSGVNDHLTEDFNSSNDQEGPHKTVTITRIAPPSASEQNDRRAVRCRSRRERPRKLLPYKQGGINIAIHGPRFHTIEPDIDSFVSSCFPGVALPPPQTLPTMNDWPLRRANLIRKRSLPSMSFLSTATLAGAEKKRKREEQARQKLMAEEAAKKIVNSTMQLPDVDVGMMGEESVKKGEGDLKFSWSKDAKHENTAIPTEDGKVDPNPREDSRDAGKQSKEPTISTIETVEGTSNVLMPPLLIQFLNSLKKHKC